MPAQRPFAVFDLDGTLIRWQLYHALADELAREGLFSTIDYSAVHAARDLWKKRKSESAYMEYERILIDAVDKAIVGVSLTDFQAACGRVIGEHKDQVHTYTRDLMRELRGQGYLLFAISASQAQLVELVADYYQFDDFGGSDYTVADGKLTGEKHILRREHKPVYLRELITKHNATWVGSVAIGDSEGDIPMLSAVETPIAFNPTRLLYEHAKQHGWKIVVERKNVIYHLEAGPKAYVLR